MFKTEPLVWAKDDEGNRYLCPFESLSDPNHISDRERDGCVSDDTSLQSRRSVPSNEETGRIKFPHSASLN